MNRREESHQVLDGRSPLSTYVEVGLAMRGTDYALLDQLGRVTDGVAVLRPQGSSATFPDLPSFVSKLSVLIIDATSSATKTYRGRPRVDHNPFLLCQRNDYNQFITMDYIFFLYKK